MADISVIKVNNADYTIKDTTARNHIAATNNPHGVTASQVGLGNVENKSSATIRSELTSSNVTTALGYTPVNPNTIGAANGIAPLGSDSKVPASYLPSFVDDVVDGYLYNGKFYKESAHTTEITAESDKIYVDITDDVNKTYRWSGTAYVEISSSLALGETSSTAYRGDRGKTAYDHASETKVSSASASGLYKVGVTSQGHISSVTEVTKSDITALGIPAQDTTYSAGTGLSLSGTTINHSNSITSGSATPTGDTTNKYKLNLPKISYDAQGHISGVTTRNFEVKPVAKATTYSNSHDVDITPAGSVSKPSITVTPTAASTLTSVATAGTVPSWSASVSDETLSFSFSAGAMPTFNSADRLTGASAELASAPSFSGTAKYLMVEVADATT